MGSKLYVGGLPYSVTGDRLQEIFAERFSVSEKIDTILQRVATGIRLRFSDLFGDVVSRVEVVVTFLALPLIAQAEESSEAPALHPRFGMSFGYMHSRWSEISNKLNNQKNHRNHFLTQLLSEQLQLSGCHLASFRH